MAFVSIESGHEQMIYKEKMAAAQNINQTINYMSQKFWYYQAQVNWTLQDYTTKVSMYRIKQ